MRKYSLSRNKSKLPLGIILLVLLIVGVAFVYTSSMFERNIPEIKIVNNGYWNLKKPIDISISDESGLKSYKISLKSSAGVSTLQYEQYISPENLIKIELKPPRSAFSLKDKIVTLIVEASDASKWNFSNGNSAIKEFKLHIDKKRPKTSIVNNSYKIRKGGSALVIFKAVDDNLNELYIELDSKRKFKPQPFYQDGYYISLLAWPITDRSFGASIIAKDHAGNISKTHIPLYIKQKHYRTSKIKLTDKFLKGKIADLAEEFEETQGYEDSIKQFKIINEDVRAKNENLIHTLSSNVDDDMIDEFKINRMYPLKNATVVANFGDYRKYYYKGKKVSESYHLGLDLASNAMAKIRPQNGGDVVFSDYNGLYGNMPMLYHGLGLYTLYGHCSSIKVNEGDIVNSRDAIANTGKSGYAMGDHLHFGILVQGVEVYPKEWMDSAWIKTNISDIIKTAKDIINKS
jgi:murein DD-endopeptidase MepM/ murein hydrolase activator NlpD